jgi:hypothetical protein
MRGVSQGSAGLGLQLIQPGIGNTKRDDMWFNRISRLLLLFFVNLTGFNVARSKLGNCPSLPTFRQMSDTLFA